MTLMKRVLVILWVLGLAGCSSSEADEDVQFNENSPMYAIQQEGVLEVAVAGIEPFGLGFSADLGRMIADDLGVEAEFTPMDSDEMGARVAEGTIDIAFPVKPVTYQELRVRGPDVGYAFASPYFIAHQRLLVPEGSEVEGLADLEDRRICSFLNEETQVDVSRLIEAEVEKAQSLEECDRRLKSGRVDAVTASDALLASIPRDGDPDSPVVVGEDINTEGYAAITVPGAMATYVIDKQNEIEEEGRWMELYEKHLGPYLGPVEGPPALTLQDAASLYPPD